MRSMVDADGSAGGASDGSKTAGKFVAQDEQLIQLFVRVDYS